MKTPNVEQPLRNNVNDNADQEEECILKNRRITIFELRTSFVSVQSVLKQSEQLSDCCQISALHLPCLSLKKVKSVPLQAWRGPEGSRKLRFPALHDNGTGWW